MRRWIEQHAWFLAALSGVAILYGAALNPYYLPDTYDNVLYHGAARSMADGQGYRFGGEVITDWPPLFPALLAIPHLLGLHGVFAAKVVVWVLALGGIALARRIGQAEDRPWPGLAALGIALAPTALQMGTRIMAEWPYMLFSFAFLLALRRTRERRDAVSILGAGLLLGAAGLTRYTGLFLMAAVAWQGARSLMAREAAEPWWRRTFGEIAVAFAGLAIWIGWGAYLTLAARGGEVMEPQNLSASSYGDFHPFAVIRAATNLLFCTHSVFGRWPTFALVVIVLAGCMGALGLAVRARRGAFSPSDAYTLAVLSFLAFYEHGEIPTLTRYLLPLGPILLSWVFEGVRALQVWSAGRIRNTERMASVVAGMWLLGFVAVDVHLVAIGKPDLHGGLSPLASPDPESFYRGPWRDLYRACAFIRDQPDPGAVSGLPNSTRYLAAWTGRELVEMREGTPVDALRFRHVAYLVVPEGHPTVAGFRPVARFGSLAVWRRSP